jgi:glucosylglycerate synthase
LKLREIRGMKQNVFDFPTELWARILYEMSVACRDRVGDSGLLIRSLMPLFWGKSFCFVKKTVNMTPHQIESVIEEDCMIFEMTKPYLVKRWTEGHQPASPGRP